ncbi:hypothetical protein HH214_13255 [Mucilaginibacter robiniae]|uniref:Uncharacterized protein n=1 Tax=Mucilaginibacter robiniae TaxID=2728022 RepID=A0A7L5E8R3_9SPHI|nr:hypothetical protein [Mucilaginibacter robiniae]QJD96766.1 hypothetical protein HH214_13255 [Mucilaginibacter robiniae]
MLTFTIGLHHLEIANSVLYDEGTADNLEQYDAVYLNEDHYKPTSLYIIKLYQDGKLIKNVLIGALGSGIGIHRSSQVIEQDRMVICCCDMVFCLSLPELDLLWKTKADWAVCFEIFKYMEDYIVHGEIDISRIDKDGKIMWQQSGADIFTTAEGKNDFILTKDYILATDWGYCKYKFDFDGNRLS